MLPFFEITFKKGSFLDLLFTSLATNEEAQKSLPHISTVGEDPVKCRNKNKPTHTHSPPPYTQGLKLENFFKGHLGPLGQIFECSHNFSRDHIWALKLQNLRALNVMKGLNKNILFDQYLHTLSSFFAIMFRKGTTHLRPMKGTTVLQLYYTYKR